MSYFQFKIEDETRMRFIKVAAENAIDALLKAIKETGIVNPTSVFQKQEDGDFKSFQF